jgi:hypothetical protein
MDIACFTAPVSIVRELERYRDEGFRRVNVIHPYKRDAFAYVTPIELCLFVCCLVARVDLIRLIRVSVLFILVEIAALPIVTYFPQIVLFIPHTFGFR